MNRAAIANAQPAPVSRPGAPSLHDVAQALHRDRRDHGQRVYGTLLQAFNGRTARIDRVQETLDNLVYELQDLIEGAALEQALAEYRNGLRVLMLAGAGAGDAADLYEDLLNPAALAVRADRLADELIIGARQ